MLLIKAFNRNQLLILKEISENRNETITQIIIGKVNKEIPVSTLRLNLQILRNPGLIEFGNSSDFRIASLTDAGITVNRIIFGGEKNA